MCAACCARHGPSSRGSGAPPQTAASAVPIPIASGQPTSEFDASPSLPNASLPPAAATVMKIASTKKARYAGPGSRSTAA
jgi:hypothetical protein